MTGREQAVPALETKTTRLEATFREMVQKVTSGKSIVHQDFLDAVSLYPNTLKVYDNVGVQEALINNKSFRPKLRNLDVASEFSYAVSRLINTEDFGYLDEAEVHFTDDHASFYKLENIKRASSRGRHYAVKIDDEGKKHLTYLIRRTDNAETPTDVLELMSLISTVELARHRIKGSRLRRYTVEGKDGQKRVRIPYIDEFKSLDKNHDYSLAEIKAWGKKSGLRLTPGELKISSLDTAPKLEDTASYSTVLKIQEKLLDLEIGVDAAILGNDFTYVLTATTGLLNEQDLEQLGKDPDVKDPLTQLNGTIKPDKLSQDQQELVKRFGYIQFLNRYNGSNSHYLEIKDRIEELYKKIQTRILSEDESPLADHISVIEFAKIDREIIDNIPDPSARELLQSLKDKNFRALNFSYPLGDNTNSLVKSLHAVLRIQNVGFFGKVGATLDYLEEEGKFSGARVGRIVLPESSTHNDPDHPVTMFKNQLKSDDLMIINTADDSEVILQVNGVLLQTLEDIKVVRDQIIGGKIKVFDENGNPIDPKKIRILLDMESAHFQSACEELGIKAVICYYTSDSTEVPPRFTSTDHQETIATSMGDRGSLAVLVSGLSVLKGLLKSIDESLKRQYYMTQPPQRTI